MVLYGVIFLSVTIKACLCLLSGDFAATILSVGTAGLRASFVFYALDYCV